MMIINLDFIVSTDIKAYSTIVYLEQGDDEIRIYTEDLPEFIKALQKIQNHLETQANIEQDRERVKAWENGSGIKAGGLPGWQAGKSIEVA